MDADQAFGQALRSLRQGKKWSQEKLSLEAEMDRNYLSLIELGRNSPSVRMVFRLCQALEAAPSDLMKDAERRLFMQSQHAAKRGRPE